MILVFLLFFYFEPINASYVNVLKDFNKMIGHKIPGMQDDQLDSKKIISFYTEKIQNHINSKSSEDQVAYIPVLELFREYTHCIKNGTDFPIRQDHFNNDEEKVDFFLKQICDNVTNWNEIMLVSASCRPFFYVNQYEKQTDRVIALENENKQLRLENEKLEKNCVEKKQSTMNSESEKIAITAKLKKAEENLEDEKSNCCDLLIKWKNHYEDQAKELAELCEEEDETKINTLKTGRNTPFPGEMLQSKIIELKQSLTKQKQDNKNLKEDIVNIITREKRSPYVWFLGGLITSFLLFKGYAYFF